MNRYETRYEGGGTPSEGGEDERGEGQRGEREGEGGVEKREGEPRLQVAGRKAVENGSGGHAGARAAADRMTERGQGEGGGEEHRRRDGEEPGCSLSKR